MSRRLSALTIIASLFAPLFVAIPPAAQAGRGTIDRMSELCGRLGPRQGVARVLYVNPGLKNEETIRVTGLPAADAAVMEGALVCVEGKAGRAPASSRIRPFEAKRLLPPK